jgi:glycosyltransferase involved in cell wall biosynthesis
VIQLTLLIPTLDRSGAEKQLTLPATRLPRDEFRVRVVTLDRGGPYEAPLRDGGISVTNVGKRRKLDLRALRQLRQVLVHEPPDILHSWLFSANSYGRLIAGKRPQFRIIISERCVDTWKSGWQLWLDRRLIPRTDRLVANSESVAAFYREVGFPAERTVVIPNGVERPGPPTICRQQLQTGLKLPTDARLACYVGRLARQKRVENLLWGMQVLRQADPRAYLLIIGDGPERERLEQYSRDVESAAHVRFVGHRDDAAQLLQLCDVFWLASDFEGMSNSLLEAMACGLPVVVSNILPNRELVQHGVHGYLIDVGDGVGYAQYTRRLFEEPPLAARLGEAGRLRIERDFPVDRMVRRHIDVYREVMQGGGQMSGDW